MGGTCIHIVHGSSRFSEDLDFDNPGIGRHDFEALSQRVKRNLELQGYTAELKITYRDAFRASLRFPGLLHDSGISGQRDEKMLIQIDTEPQGVRYNPDKFILNKFDVFSRINIVPVDILAAQKIFCIFNRSRPLGRDFFDVVFLLGKSGVNFDYLDRKGTHVPGFYSASNLKPLCLALDRLWVDSLNYKASLMLSRNRYMSRMKTPLFLQMR